MNTIRVPNDIDKQMAYSIKQITQLVPVSRSFLFEQIRLNKLCTFRCGRRRLATRQAVEDWIANLSNIK